MGGFSATPTDHLERALAELRRGAVIAVGDRLVASAEAVAPSRFGAMRDAGGLCLTLTDRRASVLKITPYDGDVARVILPADASPALVQALADPSRDLASPMKGPFSAERDGDASVERIAVSLCKRAGLLPAVLTCAAQSDDVLHFDPDILAQAMAAEAFTLDRFADAKVPLALAPEAQLHGFRPSDGGEDHYAIVVGDPSRSEPVLVRAHSECFTGDLLGSLKCDCGPQLRAALAQIAANGAGVLLYLAQEGRGIGMANKLRAYALQDQGFDTVDANHRLGFEDDERDFRVAALMLEALGFGAVEVMTNNPRKTEAFERNGIRVVRRVPLAVGRTEQNDAYLATKARRSGHML